MKTILTSVMLTGLVIMQLSCSPTRTVYYSTPASTSTSTTTVVVEAPTDISYNLDLRAVASIFADARNLEDFEYRLNNVDHGISNLDLNNDGFIDYLRVVETFEK
ncbi:MAG: hypothetical protein LBV39_06535, partial [Bacteroidales bacterium]|nr:hypothetical protein [Bacteroidales bacterium]